MPPGWTRSTAGLSRSTGGWSSGRRERPWVHAAHHQEQEPPACGESDRVVVYAGRTADRLEPIAIRRASEADPGEGWTSSPSGRSGRPGHLHAMRGRLHESGGFRDDRDAVRRTSADDRGACLYINKRIENQAQAERMAKAELRDKNRKEQTASLSGMGDTRFRRAPCWTFRDGAASTRST